MAVLLATFSVVVFYCESILLLYQAWQQHDDDDRSCFIILVSIFVTSQLLTNTYSALLISTNMDFSVKTWARLLCAGLHLGQQGVMWRLGKMVMSYDQKDWHEFVLLRMIGVSVQTIPYLAIQSYLFLTSTMDGVMSIISLVVSLMSASVGMTSFTIRNHVHVVSWTTSNSRSANSKKHCGCFLLLLGTSFGLACRMCSIILMCVETLYWIVVPLVLHMSLFLLVYLLTKTWMHQPLSWKDVTRQIVFSYLNMFDLVDECFNRIKCKYVLYHTVILIENITLTAVWMVSSSMDYTIKMVMILTILTCCICSIILKFTAGGLLFHSTSYVSSFENALDVKHEAHADMSRQQKSSISETVCETLESTNLHSVDNTLYMEFGLPISYSASTATSNDKPWDFTPSQRVERQKQNGCGHKRDIVNVFNGPLTMPRCQTNIADGANHKSTRIYSIQQNNESESVANCDLSIPQHNGSSESEANCDLYASNSRNTNTPAPSNVTSNQVSNDIPSYHSIDEHFNLKKHTKTILSIITKSKLQRKHKKIKLFSPSGDSFFHGETVPEFDCTKNRKAGLQCINTKSYNNEVEEFIWDEEITSVSSSANDDFENETSLKTTSFLRDSSRSGCSWPSLSVGCFNPNVLPKENPNSSESIKLWLSDVHRHTQNMSHFHHDKTDGHLYTYTCHRDVTKHNTNSTDVNTDRKVTNDQPYIHKDKGDLNKGLHLSGEILSSEYHQTSQKYLKHVHNSSSGVPEQCIQAAAGVGGSAEESTSGRTPTNDTTSTCGSGDQGQASHSLSNINNNFNKNGITNHRNINGTFSSACSLTQTSTQDSEQASLGEQFSVPFCVKLDDMESLV